MIARPLILIVDDDDAVRDSLQGLLESEGYCVEGYASAKSFLEAGHVLGRCLIADIRMPEMDGLALQDEIVRRGINIPVIIMTGHGDIPLAVRAMKAGAIDMLEKPFDADVVLKCIERALMIGEENRDEIEEARSADDLVARLTPRENSVLRHLVLGQSNKIVGFELGISARTVETHRARIMIKMKARSLPDLVRITIAARHAPARIPGQARMFAD